MNQEQWHCKKRGCEANAWTNIDGRWECHYCRTIADFNPVVKDPLTPAPAPQAIALAPEVVESPAAPVDWTDPGHRLTEAELDAATAAYIAEWNKRAMDDGSTRRGLEAAIRAFLRFNRAPEKASEA